MKKLLFSLLVLSIVLGSGCAQRAASIEPTHISTKKYEKLSCKQLKEEFIKVDKRLALVSALQDEAAEKDAASLTVWIIGFGYMPRGVDREEEVGKLKGESKAIKDIAEKKNCSFAASMH